MKGFYTDDSWGPGGPTEMDGNAVKDMGLSAGDVADITAGYLYATSVLYPEILSRGKFVWDQTLNHDPFAPLNGDCPQPWVKQASCATDLRGLCSPTAAPQQNRTLLYGFSPGSCTGTDPNHLTEVDTDVANFLLVRGARSATSASLTPPATCACAGGAASNTPAPSAGARALRFPRQRLGRLFAAL